MKSVGSEFFHCYEHQEALRTSDVKTLTYDLMLFCWQKVSDNTYHKSCSAKRKWLQHTFEFQQSRNLVCCLKLGPETPKLQQWTLW